MVCKNCGIEFNKTAPRHFFCCTKCAKHYRCRHPKHSPCVCINCGKTFIPKEKNRNQYCSRECAFAYKRGPNANYWKGGITEKRRSTAQDKRAKGKVCVICGSIFHPYNISEIYCSNECRKTKGRNDYHKNVVAILRQQREHFWATREERKPFNCMECGQVVIPKYETKSNRQRKYCSNKCMNKYTKRIEGRTHKERARRYGVSYETVDPIKVFMRDGYRCQLCNIKLNKKNRGTNRDDAPELDHIIPLSKGGEHSYRNTQCSCRKCNMDKGNQERGQLRMFG